MRMVSIEELQGEEVLARTITDLHGRVLLTKGIRIRDNYITRLNELGIETICIEDDISEGIEIETILCTETKNQAMSVLEKEMKNFSRNKGINMDEIHKTASIIIDNVLSNIGNLGSMKDLRVKDEYTFSHSVNVCTLSVFLGSKLGLPFEKLQSMAAGCLLHDLGKVLVPTEILDKQSSLTNDEYNEIKKHPMYGYEAIKNDIEVSPTTKVVVLMHHEKIDGSGYPNGFKGNSIHESARICSICDAYDAMTSDRSYRKALSFPEAAEQLNKFAGIHFDKEMVALFLKSTPLYTPGTIVQLNNGAVGIVMKTYADKVTRPVLRLIYNQKNKVKYNNYIIDLTHETDLHILKTVNFNRNEYESL